MPASRQVAECVPIPATDFDALVEFASAKRIDFAVIGADAQLVGGLWDVLEAAGIHALGPSKAAAVLEGSKGFVKDLCTESGHSHRRLSALPRRRRAAKAFADSLGFPVVIKADGLAAGKGVIIAASKAESDKAIDFMFEGGFGDSGQEIVVEEFMEGEEASFFALSAMARMSIPLAGAQDHKRVGDGDTGPNTGGMGAYSPAPVLHAGAGTSGDGAIHQAHRGGDGRTRHALYGRALSGADDHQERPQAGRI